MTRLAIVVGILAVPLLAIGCSNTLERSEASSVQRLELDTVIDQEFESEFPTAQYRTLRDQIAAEDAELKRSQSLDGDELARWALERTVGWVMDDGSHTRTEEFQMVERRTRQLFWQRVAGCARKIVATIEVVDLQLPSPEDIGEQYDPSYTATAERLGLTPSGLVDLRYKCSQAALDLTNPDSDEFASSLDELHELHMTGIEAWLQKYPVEEIIDGRLPADLLP